MRIAMVIILIVSIVMALSCGACAAEEATGYVKVLGEVKHPGLYSVTATTTVRDAVRLAGGLGAYADLHGIYVTRTQGSKSVRVNIDWTARNKKDRSAAYVLMASDTVYVPERQNVPVVTVVGEVTKQGRWPLSRCSTLTRALSMSGAVTTQADLSSIVISRTVRGKRGHTITLKANLNAILAGKETDPKLLQGDVVVVPRLKKNKPGGFIRIAR